MWLCAAISVLVPFENLNDMIDAGVLLSLIMTNMCVILLRRKGGSGGMGGGVSPVESNINKSWRSPGLLLSVYVGLVFVAAFAAAKLPREYYQLEVREGDELSIEPRP